MYFLKIKKLKKINNESDALCLMSDFRPYCYDINQFSFRCCGLTTTPIDAFTVCLKWQCFTAAVLLYFGAECLSGGVVWPAHAALPYSLQAAARRAATAALACSTSRRRATSWATTRTATPSTRNTCVHIALDRSMNERNRVTDSCSR